MPVYLMTAHAYRSWREDHPRGYVQRREGLKESSVNLARHRAAIARHAEARFEVEVQELLHSVIVEIAAEQEVRLHACVTCPTHVHILVSFRSPACICGASKYCGRGCEARERAEGVIVRMKRKMGQAVAAREGTKGRPWFSRGWDLTRVGTRGHFDHLVGEYLPKHEVEQAGVFRKYS